MAPNMKGFALFTRAINGDVSLLAPDKYRYALSLVAVFVENAQVSSSRNVYLVVSSFPDEF